MAQKKKTMYAFRFHETDHKAWKKRAKSAKLDLTAWIEQRLNQDLEVKENQFEKI